jgi:proline iminopeptidase
MAIEYACAFPDRVSHLVLIASSPITGEEIYKEADRYFEESVCPERKAELQITMQRFSESGDQSFVGRMLALGPRIWYDYHFDASTLWEGVEVNYVGAGIIWGSMFADYNVANALKAISCPIFLALGRYDYFNPPHLWEKYRDHASDLTVRIFEKSGHTPQLEEPLDFDRELMEWLGDV